MSHDLNSSFPSYAMQLFRGYWNFVFGSNLFLVEIIYFSL